MDFDVKNLKLSKLLIFGKATWMSIVFSRSGGWGEQSGNGLCKRWSLPACKCHAVTWHKVPETPEITEIFQENEFPGEFSTLTGARPVGPLSLQFRWLQRTLGPSCFGSKTHPFALPPRASNLNVCVYIYIIVIYSLKKSRQETVVSAAAGICWQMAQGLLEPESRGQCCT